MSQYSSEYDNNQFEVIGEELDASNGNQIRDPTAEFLAQERANLEEIGEDLFTSQNAQHEFEGNPQSFVMNNDEEAFEQEQFDDSSSFHGSASQPPAVYQESDEILQWKEKRAQMIAAKDSRASVDREEMVEKAKRDLLGFYERYEAQKSKTQASNRE
eukprot:Sdes_comp9206_c0_seq1m687